MRFLLWEAILNHVGKRSRKSIFLAVIRNEGPRDIPLKWGDASERQLAGKTIHLRFFLRSINIYEVTARTNL